MKKRILSLTLLVITLISVFAFTSCKEKTTYEIVSEAITKTLALESLDLDFDEYAKTITQLAGQSVAVTVESNHEMQIVDFNSKNSKFDISSVTTVSGQGVRSETYYDGNDYYVESNGTKTKIEGDSEDASLLNSVNNVKTLIMQIPEELLAEIELTENEENGTKALELEIEDAKFKEIFEDYIDLQKDVLDKQYDGKYGDIVLKNVTNGKISIVVNEDGYLDSYTVSSKMIFTMDYSVGKLEYDIRISVDSESSFNFNNPGEKVTIEAPEDIDDYKLQED